MKVVYLRNIYTYLHIVDSLTKNWVGCIFSLHGAQFGRRARSYHLNKYLAWYRSIPS